MSKYKITITQIDEDVPYTDSQWRKVVDVPDEEHKELYRYVETPTTKTIESVIYDQTVEALDMAGVIKAVNEL